MQKTSTNSPLRCVAVRAGCACQAAYVTLGGEQVQKSASALATVVLNSPNLRQDMALLEPIIAQVKDLAAKLPLPAVPAPPDDRSTATADAP